ncbi:MAG: class I SAM-dependent methyltransferase [Candidatus Omnitrophica bacterium]|nr:class I SAM-dependent methyltransferase [Candidatus Omnitrophota bacterium]
MQDLFRKNSKAEIYRQLEELFGHPGTLLFRARELAVIDDYMARYPLPIEKRVLDLGCAEGHIGGLLFNRIDVGLDLFPGDLEKTKNSVAYKNAVAADARKLPFKAQAFDLVFSNSVIEHIPGIEEVLSEVSRVLSDGGFFVFTAPSKLFSDYLYLTNIFRRTGLSFLGLDKLYSKARNTQLAHHNLFSDGEWGKFLQGHCLEVVYSKYYLPEQEIYFWDKICIFLRLSAPIASLHRMLTKKYNDRVNRIIVSQDKCALGGAVLIVAKRKGR